MMRIHLASDPWAVSTRQGVSNKGNVFLLRCDRDVDFHKNDFLNHFSTGSVECQYYFLALNLNNTPVQKKKNILLNFLKKFQDILATEILTPISSQSHPKQKRKNRLCYLNYSIDHKTLRANDETCGHRHDNWKIQEAY